MKPCLRKQQLDSQIYIIYCYITNIHIESYILLKSLTMLNERQFYFSIFSAFFKLFFSTQCRPFYPEVNFVAFFSEFFYLFLFNLFLQNSVSFSQLDLALKNTLITVNLIMVSMYYIFKCFLKNKITTPLKSIQKNLLKSLIFHYQV